MDFSSLTRQAASGDEYFGMQGWLLMQQQQLKSLNLQNAKGKLKLSVARRTPISNIPYALYYLLCLKKHFFFFNSVVIIIHTYICFTILYIYISITSAN
jgi:hypothetical protein